MPKVWSVRIDDELFEFLEHKALLLGKNRSDFGREILLKGIENDEKVKQKFINNNEELYRSIYFIQSLLSELMEKVFDKDEYTKIMMRLESEILNG